MWLHLELSGSQPVLRLLFALQNQHQSPEAKTLDEKRYQRRYYALHRTQILTTLREKLDHENVITTDLNSGFQIAILQGKGSYKKKCEICGDYYPINAKPSKNHTCKEMRCNPHE